MSKPQGHKKACKCCVCCNTRKNPAQRAVGTMKMSPAAYAALKADIAVVAKANPDAPAKYRAQGLSDMRFRWDLLHASKHNTSPLYKAGLNDAHIDTALKRIVTELYARKNPSSGAKQRARGTRVYRDRQDYPFYHEGPMLAAREKQASFHRGMLQKMRSGEVPRRPELQFEKHHKAAHAEALRGLRGLAVRYARQVLPNPRVAAPVDRHAVAALVLFIDNDRALHDQQHVPIRQNLMRRWAKGTYDFEKSVTLFGYLTEAGAKKYANEDWTGHAWHVSFPADVRRAAARELAKSFKAEAELGNYDHLNKKGLAKNPARQPRSEAAFLVRLRREALQACRNRDHTMKAAAPAEKDSQGHFRQDYSCRYCAARVCILTHPSSRQTNISGPAVAEDCTP